MFKEPTYRSIEVIGWPDENENIVIDFLGIRKAYFEGDNQMKEGIKEFLDYSIKELNSMIGFHGALVNLVEMGIVKSSNPGVAITKVNNYTEVSLQIKRLRQEIKDAERK